MTTISWILIGVYVKIGIVTSIIFDVKNKE